MSTRRPLANAREMQPLGSTSSIIKVNARLHAEAAWGIIRSLIHDAFHLQRSLSALGYRSSYSLSNWTCTSSDDPCNSGKALIFEVTFTHVGLLP